jgi:hypothetical protein
MPCACYSESPRVFSSLGCSAQGSKIVQELELVIFAIHGTWPRCPNGLAKGLILVPGLVWSSSEHWIFFARHGYTRSLPNHLDCKPGDLWLFTCTDRLGNMTVAVILMALGRKSAHGASRTERVQQACGCNNSQSPDWRSSTMLQATTAFTGEMVFFNRSNMYFERTCAPKTMSHGSDLGDFAILPFECCL